MDKTQVYKIFSRFEQMHAVVIGDVMIDTYLWGKVERISPEAPIPIVSVTRRENRLGGAANVSLNLQELGATPFLFSVIGGDDKGKKFKKLLSKKNLSPNGIFIDPKRKTTVKSRIISGGQHIARVDEETTGLIEPEMENKLFTAIENRIEKTKIDVIIFVDYDKGVISPTLIERVNELALKKGIPTAVDPKIRNFNCYKNISLFKPNFKEFVQGVGIPIEKGDFMLLEKVAGELKQKQNFEIILVTLSELGVFISNGISEQYFPAEIRYIADVSGAGDTVISLASLAMASGLPPKTIAFMSNLAGGLVCEKNGVVPINKDQLIAEMLKHKV